MTVDPTQDGKAEGPGIGEYIQITLDKFITVDKILVNPGWFDFSYWQQNNRVKRLLIVLDNHEQEFEFSDSMRAQECILAKPCTFKTAKFIIKDIYKTTNWDDTAISEIKFFYQGKWMGIDVKTNYENYLKEVPE